MHPPHPQLSSSFRPAMISEVVLALRTAPPNVCYWVIEYKAECLQCAEGLGSTGKPSNFCLQTWFPSTPRRSDYLRSSSNISTPTAGKMEGAEVILKHPCAFTRLKLNAICQRVVSFKAPGLRFTRIG